jgi:aminodeoxyfutalosine deaminase
MFHNSLAEEYAALMAVHGFTLAEIRELAANAVRASWLPEERKGAMAAEMAGTGDGRRGTAGGGQHLTMPAQ